MSKIICGNSSLFNRIFYWCSLAHFPFPKDAFPLKWIILMEGDRPIEQVLAKDLCNVVPASDVILILLGR
jgi:hypothetical protein